MPSIGDIIMQDGIQVKIVDMKITEYEDGSTVTITTVEPAGE